MDNEKIKISRGGEKVEDVMGRRDEEELLVFENGAFQVEGDVKIGFKGRRRKREYEKLMSPELLDKYSSQGDTFKHSMRELMGSIRIVDAKDFDDCDQQFCEEEEEEAREEREREKEKKKKLRA